MFSPSKKGEILRHSSDTQENAHFMTFDNISKEQVSPESFSYKSGLKLPVGQALGFDKNRSLSLRNLTSTI